MFQTETQALLRLRQHRYARAEQDWRRAQAQLQIREQEVQELRIAQSALTNSAASFRTDAPLKRDQLLNQVDMQRQTYIEMKTQRTELAAHLEKCAEHRHRVTQCHRILKERTRSYEALKMLSDEYAQAWDVNAMDAE